MPKDPTIQKVLMIGSGPIVIGQAAEFDYAGAQACRVLREEGINVVLVNSNPATIMTDKHLADEIYLEPLNAETVARIIAKERPDGLLAGLGGQTGLTIAMQLAENGTLERYGVRLLGSPIESIQKAEDRELFRDLMKEIGQPVVPSEIATTLEQARAAAEDIGYPVIVRPAYTLGGSGGGIAANEAELLTIARMGLDMSPITQILIERCIAGWKEIEFETMRDAAGNVIAVCSMENLDPVGIHTGDSIVAAPALTLADKEYQMLRSASLDMITALGIVGGCNCQFALDPESFRYAVIEVNPRVSRSSALASKATGYPIAKITTRIALGYTLDEIANDITRKTCACFEPALDYVVVKFPKWPFDKFAGSSRQLGTQMKATGEVMAIAGSFEAALMKAVRGAETGFDTLNAPPLDDRPVRERLHDPNDRRIFTVFEALKKGVSVEEIHEITRIDRWFLWKLEGMASLEMTWARKYGAHGQVSGKLPNAQKHTNCRETSGRTAGTMAGSTTGTTAGTAVGTAAGTTVGTAVGTTAGTAVGTAVGTTVGTTVGTAVGTMAGTAVGTTGYTDTGMCVSMEEEDYREAKRLGYTDAAIRRLTGCRELPKFVYSYKMVDTCGAEFDAETPYFYSTCDAVCESRSFRRSGRPVIVVLGSGPIRIGQGIEFDYSSVHCVWTLREMGYDVVIVNNNPETVSTDYDTADRLYFEALTPEDVMGIIAVEQPAGVVVAFGGQTAIRLTGFLAKQGIRILGTSADGIDIAEDRARFDALLERFAIRRPKGKGVSGIEEAVQAAHELGYPVLLRPSYVIGGQNMTISQDEAHTRRYMERILAGGIDNPVLVDKYMPGTELEVDVISDGEDVLIPGIMEHIERAGVHSGDSIAVYPPYNLTDRFLQVICRASEQLALALGTKGLVNIQYLIYDNELYVIEVNPRASRTVPYISKVTNIPMVDIAARVMLGERLRDLGYGTGLCKTPPYCAVKVPVFSFEKLLDANSILGPEMKSTGEVLGIGKSKAEALFKGLTAAGFRVPGHDGSGRKQSDHRVPVRSSDDNGSRNHMNDCSENHMDTASRNHMDIGNQNHMDTASQNHMDIGNQNHMNAGTAAAAGTRPGVLLSVEAAEYQEVLSLAKRFYDLHMDLYATPGTAEAIRTLGLPVHTAGTAAELTEIYTLMEQDVLNYIIYTGAMQDETMADYIALHRKAMQLGIPTLTSLDTAGALADMIESRFSLQNTELVDINAMRTARTRVAFTKMHSCGNDNIFIEDFAESISCPESLCVSLCSPHYGIGADGIVLIERSDRADARMRYFNRDGSEGRMAGNNIRCVAKYLYDYELIPSDREHVQIEMGGIVHDLALFVRDGEVTSVTVDMGGVSFDVRDLPAVPVVTGWRNHDQVSADAPDNGDADVRRQSAKVLYNSSGWCDQNIDEPPLEKAFEMIDYPLKAAGSVWPVTCLSIGNPHCVIFCGTIDQLDLGAIGPAFEYAKEFPERVNTEFVRVVNRTTLRMRVWERGNGETLACGTGACAAVAAAVRKGYCDAGADVTVKLLGGDLIVNVQQDRVLLTGSVSTVYTGVFEY